MVVPAHNEASLLPRGLHAIAAAAERLGRDIEVIVVANRCTDATADIAAQSGAIVSLLTHCESGFSGNARMLAAYRRFIEFIAASAKFEFVRPCDLVARIEASTEST